MLADYRLIFRHLLIRFPPDSKNVHSNTLLIVVGECGEIRRNIVRVFIVVKGPAGLLLRRARVTDEVGRLYQSGCCAAQLDGGFFFYIFL